MINFFPPRLNTPGRTQWEREVAHFQARSSKLGQRNQCWMVKTFSLRDGRVRVVRMV
jgi:hypothetical protein